MQLEYRLYAQVIIFGGDRIPSFLPNGIMAGWIAEHNIWVVEATISRKAECIAIMRCSVVTLAFGFHLFRSVDVRFCVYRGGEVVVDT